MAVGSGRVANRCAHAVAINSSPQVAGMAAAYPAARQAWSTWTGVAGRAARYASAPRITKDVGEGRSAIDSGCDTVFKGSDSRTVCPVKSRPRIVCGPGTN
jgi:hypothetical protein